MRRLVGTFLAAATATASVAFVAPVSAQTDEPASAEVEVATVDAVDQFASVLTPDARRALAVTPGDGLLSVIVRLDDQIDLSSVLAESNPDDSSEDVIRSLQEAAAHDQFLFRILAPIWEIGPNVESFTPFWIMNGFAITATPAVIASIARVSNVAEIDIERKYQVAGVAPAGPPTSNVAAVGAPAVWAQGHTGEGVVVAVLDTGVDMLGIPGVFESEVADSYRGGLNSWFDPYSPSTEPYDPSGHGTAVASIITGADLSGSTVGVAPDAQWIAAKIFDDSGTATTSAIHSALQWVLDPDEDPSTDDGADVVNSSWTGSTPGCDTEFAADIAALRAAGVIPVFAAGNFGSFAGSSPSPSNLPGALAVGAVQSDLSIVGVSSRGPTECGGATRTFPHLVAPGDSVMAQGQQGQFVPNTGTSFAAPHVTGAIALLLGASPASTDAEIEAALVGGASDLGATGADDVFGAGLVDVSRAIDLLNGVNTDPTASISGLVFEDSDANGVQDAGELPTGSAQVSIFTPGDDGTLGTADDVIAAEAVTDPDGTWLVSGLAVGEHRVSVAPTSLPADSILTTPGTVDVTLAGGDLAIVSFGWRPPEPGSLVVSVFDDIDGGGTREAGETGLAGVSVTVQAAGADDRFGTLDDATPVVGITGDAGTFEVQGLPPGPARVTLDQETLPDRGFVSGVSAIEPLITSAGIANVDIGVHVPARQAAVVHVSLKRAGRTNNGSLAYRDEDILTWDGTRFEMLFDGSDVGLAGSDVDAFHVLDDNKLLLSLDRSIDIEGIGVVEDSDILFFEAQQLGSSTRGEFSLHLDGSDLGLVGPAADIDAIAMSGTKLLISTRGNLIIDGAGQIRDEDLLWLDLTSDGPESSGTISVFFDGSVEGLVARSEDIDAASVGEADMIVSALGSVSVGPFTAGDGDILSCGGFSSCTWLVSTPASSLGLLSGDLDGLSLPKEFGES